MTALSLLLAGLLANATSSHAEANPSFRQLLEQGLLLRDQVRVRLPAPSLEDGASPAAQQAVLDKIAGDNQPLDELLRQSPVAPFVLKIHDPAGADAEASHRNVDLWFIAYGDLDTLERKDFRQRLLNLSQGQVKPHNVTDADLAKRKIALAKSPLVQEEYFTHRTFGLFDRVSVSDTNHVVLTRTPESIVLASQMDPRFAGDAEFPNQWRSVSKGEDGEPKLGPVNPYAGAGSYLKITRLAEPQGALLVEFHLVFVEPRGWFDGANLLRSKLPIVIQSEVRALRRELAKARMP